MRTNRFWLLAAVLLLFSCAKDETEDGGGQPVPIQLTTVGLGPATRAADGINTGNFPLETPITVAVDGSNYNYKTDATSVSNPLDCQDAIPPHFPVSGSSVHVVAYYPASVQYDTEAHPFVVAADQSTEASYAASDLMIGLPQTTFEDGSGNSLIEGSGMTRKVKRTSIPVPMEFVHQLSKIKVVVTINGAVVKGVTMKNIMRSIDFNPSTGALTNVAAVATSGLDEVVMYTNSTGTSANFTTTAIIPVQNLASGTGFIDVVVQNSPSDKTLTYKLQEAGAFVSGSQYIYNLTVSNDEILCTTSVTNWDDATDYTHGDGLAMIRPKLPIEYIAPYNMKSASVMATDNHVYNSAYFYWGSNNTTPSAKMRNFINGTALQGYHLPSIEEWCSIIAPYGDRIDWEGGIHTDMSETVAWGVTNNNTNSTWSVDNYTYKVNRVFYNDYNCPDDGTHDTTGYGLRFREKDGSSYLNGIYTCGYRYEYKQNDSSVGAASLTVKVKYVGADQGVTIYTISNDSWWETPDFTVVIPACGHKGYTSADYEAGQSTYNSVTSSKLAGVYWSATKVQDSDNTHQMHFATSGVAGDNSTQPSRSESVRLFRDAD